jgi:hypothetical protein
VAVDFPQLVRDLAAEGLDLSALVDRQLAARPGGLDAPTPAEGWSVSDQLTHLAYIDEVLLSAIDDPLGFELVRDVTIASGGDVASMANERRRELGASRRRHGSPTLAGAS